MTFTSQDMIQAANEYAKQNYNKKSKKDFFYAGALWAARQFKPENNTPTTPDHTQPEEP